MTLTVGGLFAGYGGIELALSSVLDAHPAWFVEFDKAPSKVLAHHWPDTPNLGDVTKVDWNTVEPVDIITGGSPCQDLSHAGKRAGMTEGTRSNLWVQMREAINVIRPQLVVWENVRGAYSATADSALEPCPGCVGGGDGQPVLRALGRVLGDLADLGYDCRWYGLRAADAGAAHGRFRVFLFAVPADAAGDSWWLGNGDGGAAADTERGGWDGGAPDSLGSALRGTAAAWGGEGAGAGLTLLPTPVADNSRGLPSPGTDFQSLPNAVCALLPTPKTTDAQHSSPADLKRHDPGLRAVSGLLPTPRATDGTKGGPNQRGSSGDLMLPSAVQTLLPTPTTAPTTGNGHARNLGGEVRALLPTPRTQNNENRQSEGYGGERGNYHGLVNGTVSWGDYAPAIARAERAAGRTAPPPTEPGPKGNPRLSPAFVEWLMMLPAGHVTDPAIGLTRNEQLKALGNGVVPAQCAAALRTFLWDAYGIEVAT